MKKTSNRLHSLFAALAALILAAALAVPAFAVEVGFADLYYRMFDDAEVLTEDEDNELEDALEELSLRELRCDHCHHRVDGKRWCRQHGAVCR